MKGSMQFILVALFAAVFSARVRGQSCHRSVTTVSGSHTPRQVCAGKLIFEDNFNALDSNKWQHEKTLSGGGNWEFQWYSNSRANSFTRNGKLVLKPSLVSDQYGERFLSSGTLNIDGCTNAEFYGCSRVGTPDNILNPIKSARIQTAKSFSFRYGIVEISAKMPTGDWLWPGIWMLPKRNSYGTWPSSGEIDIAESRGNRNLVMGGKNIGVENVGSTLHYGPNPNLDSWGRAHWERNEVPGFNAGFRKYQLEWTPEHIKFSIDGIEMGTIAPTRGGFWQQGGFPANVPNPWRSGSKMAPFDQEFYIILNLAVGGTNYFPDGASNPNPKPWTNDSPTAARDFWNGKNRWLPTWNLGNSDNAALQVDYVRVWAL